MKNKENFAGDHSQCSVQIVKKTTRNVLANVAILTTLPFYFQIKCEV